VAALLALPAGAAAETATITIPGKYFDPPRSTLVAGDVVLFQNHDLVTHNVRIAGGLFDSGPIARLTSWSQQMDAPGSYPYVCTLHAFMSGNLDVVAATLTGPAGPVLAGEQLALKGRAPAGTPHVGLERATAGGAWSPVGAGATPAADGGFTLTAPAVEGASYRATTPAGTGATVTPNVTARVDVHLMVMRGKHHTSVHVHTMPATSGFVATLQLYARWHFIWRDHAHMKLDRHGRAMFRLPAGRRVYARVALSRRAGSAALVRSGTVKLWNGRAARDPDGIVPAMPEGGGGHHHG
jgi:plastocyanin